MTTYIDSERAEDMLQSLGIEPVSRSGDEILALCPQHFERTGREDRNPSWWFNAETGQHICFSCKYKGGIRDLVADQFGWNQRQVLEWLVNYEVDLSVKVERMELRDSYVSDAPPMAMTKSRMALYTEPPADALAARNLTAEACRHYGILWDPAERCWITPLYHAHDLSLMGWQAKGQDSRLFNNQPKGIKKAQTLFGLDVFAGGRMIVVESPLDCARLRGAGFEGAVSTCGASITEDQIRLMLRADSILLAMDHDDAGEKALRDFFESAKRLHIDFRTFAYAGSDAKDPGDMTDEEIRAGVENSCHSIFGIDRLVKA